MRAVRLSRGVRYAAKASIGMTVGGRIVYRSPDDGIWVDCIDCGRRDRLLGENTERITEERAIILFTSRGWSVMPTLCPECNPKNPPTPKEPT